ncbi:MAG TPA: FtsX-like permease family protein [Hyphomicrobiaceae bacterium]|nr:FtsX-like permease family protein [Hyphomicrobiaceae bacterium]
MTINTATAPAPVSSTSNLARIFSLAMRELRGGLNGFYVFIACLALGVAVIAGVGALTDALKAGFERQGESLLGGDVTLARPHRRAEPAERTWMERHGRLSETATLRAMARRPDGTEQSLVELKAIDAAYPLVGQLTLAGEASVERAVHQGDGAAVDPILLERLGLKIGDRMQLGKTTVEIRATVAAEPDRLADRLSFGPRVFVSTGTLERTALAEPGSLVRWRYAIKLAAAGNTGDGGLVAFRDEVKRDLPDSGFMIADRRDPHPSVTRTLERLRQFLTLIGLTTLLVGGVGVANSVAAFIERRRQVIATFKSLGATSSQVFAVHLTQVALITGIGVALGLGLGLSFPYLLSALVGDALPIKVEVAINARTLLVSTAYGLLVSLLFTLWPLGRAEMVRPSVLFREQVVREPVLPRWHILALTAGAAGGLLALALGTSESQRIALYFCLSLAGILALFFALGAAVTLLARRVPRPRRPELALAISNLGSPDGLTRSVILSLGTGLSLLVAVALADTSIVSELSSRLPKNSPDYFVLDIPPGDISGFVDLVHKEIPAAHVNQAPMLRGRLVRLGDRPVEQIKAPPEAAWVLTGDRGLTFADDVPEGSAVVQGEWWPPDYAGPPLVSFEAELAKGLGLKVGDSVTVNVLGRNLTAQVANLRDVHWESLAINFIMVFSPNALRAAPHNLLATIALPGDVPLSTEAGLAKSIGRMYPAVTTIRVRDAINAFSAIFDRIMLAVRIASSVTLVAGALVLAGALVTAQRQRIQQSVILKVLGATRGRILRAHLAEYLMLAFAAALLAAVLGSLAAWVALTSVMDLSFVFSASAIGQAIGIAVLLVAVLGGIGTVRVFRAPAVPYLRSE